MSTKKQDRKKKQEKQDAIVTIEVKAGDAQALMNAVRGISSNKMPIPLAVKMRRVLRAIGEYVEPLNDELGEIFKKHSKGKSGITQSDPAFQRYNEEVEPHLETLYTISFEPLELQDLEDADLDVVGNDLDLMLTHGVLAEPE